MEDIRLDRIEDALEDFKQGKFVIVVDDEDRENEGDLIMCHILHVEACAWCALCAYDYGAL